MAETLVGCSCKDSSGFACTSQQTREDQKQAREKRFRWSDGIAHAKRYEKKRAEIYFPTYSPQTWNRQSTFFTLFFATISRVKKSYFSLFL
jgi:hypothetical protein